MKHNPWFAAAVARAHTTYAGTDEHGYEVAAIRDEYTRSGEHGTETCKCGGDMHFKASVGAHKCVSCGMLLTASGKFL